MRTTRILLVPAFLVAIAGLAFGELEAKDWGALQSSWNKAFKPGGSGDLMQSLAKGEFPEAVDDIAKGQGQDVAKRIESLVKTDIEPYLAGKAEVQLEALEKLRAADDTRALKLLVTTVKLAAGDLAGLRKAEAEAKKGLEEAMKGLTKTDKGMVTGSPEVIAAKNRSEARLQVVQPFITHAIKIKRAALAGFGGARGDKTMAWLVSDGIKDKDVEVRAGVAEALAEVEHPEAAKILEKALSDREAVVRLAALSSLIAKKAEASKAAILGGLKDSAWEVRAMVLEAVQTLGFKDAETIEALIADLEREEGRLREDLDRVLYAITGKSYYGDAELWKRWWEGNRAKWGAAGAPEDKTPAEPAKPQEHKGPQATCSFYGIQTKSHNIIFILDVSGSMAEKANLASLPAGAKGPTVTGGEKKDPGVPDPGDRPQGETKLDVLKWQLKKSIGMLPPKALFNVIFYSETFEVWSETMQMATPLNKQKAFEYVDKQTPLARTNIFDAMEKAFAIATGTGPKAGGAGDPRYGGGQGGADTFYLLSDGSPNFGRIPEPDAIVAEIRKINELRKIIIHTIAVGGAFNPSFMERLAKENGGECIVVK
jgi:hypothetical protein